MTISLIEQYKFSKLQMASEAFLVDVKGKPLVADAYIDALQLGNKHSSKFTKDEAEYFSSQWEVIDQINTKTGFAATLFKSKQTDSVAGLVKDELVISFRSTEFIDDAVRDNIATNELEISETGWAWGQLRDMEAWYAGMSSAGGHLAGKEFSVTGYSLGGHLATAFNLMHDGAATKVVTFNGAGVGKAENFNPSDQLASFAQMTSAQSEFFIAQKFADTDAMALYRAVRLGLESGWQPDQASRFMDQYLDDVYQDRSSVPRELINARRKLDNAIDNIAKLIEEGVRISELTPGGEEGGKGPLEVDPENIDALKLDYQLAVLFASEKTSADNVFQNLWNGYLGKKYIGDFKDNQFDLRGHAGPSAVANSQWHVGEDVPVFIEDQPLYRGGVAGQVLAHWVKYGVKLLHDSYNTRDFGDTHSLVLIQDSLAVQTLLVNLLQDNSRDAQTLQSTLFAVLDAASNLVSENGDLLYGEGQGKAAGDVLENVLNALSSMLDLASSSSSENGVKKLVGDSTGNTWHEVKDVGKYTGRESFYEVVNVIRDSPIYSGLLGKAELSALPSSAAETHTEFGNFLAIIHLSSFALTGSGVSELLGANHKDFFEMWTHDAQLTDQEISDGHAYFTNTYLDARAEFGQRLSYLNAVNAVYDVSIPIEPGEAVRGIAFKYALSKDVYIDISTQLTLRSNVLGPFDSFVVFGTEQNDSAMAGDGMADKLFGNGGDDVIFGDAGSDHLEGNAGDDDIDGGVGDDSLYGGSGDDRLRGGDDDDSLMGGDGDDWIDGGIGNDRLLGGDGDDTYFFSGIFGHDVIIDSGHGNIQVQGVTLKGGRAVEKGLWEEMVAGVRYTYVLATDGTGGTDLIIRPEGGDDSINVRGWSQGDLGIELENVDEDPTEPAPGTSVIEGSIIKRIDANGKYVTDANHNYVSDGIDAQAFDLLRGTSGVDIIRGYGGNDMLDGLAGDDTLEGGNGDDLITGGIGRDVLVGGAGNDFLFGSAAGVQTNGGRPIVQTDLKLPGTEIARGFSWVAARQTTMIDGEEQSLIMFAGNNLAEVLNDGASTIDGGAGDDYIRAGSGDDLARGGADNDTVIGGGGADVLFGEEGDDELQGDGSVTPVSVQDWTSSIVEIERHGADVLDGGAGNDKMWGQGRDDQLYGGAGDDFLWGDSDKAHDVPFAHHGDDYLDGGDGDDQLVGNGGGDQLFGGAGKDKLFGDAGAEDMDGEFHGRDLLDGGADADFLAGGGDDDRLRGGDGSDVLWGDATIAGLGAQFNGNDDLDGGAGDDFLYGGGGNDHLVGGSGNDQLAGDAAEHIVAGEHHGSDTLDGGDGDDIVFGLGGDDILFGGDGDDDVEGDDAALDGRFHGDDELHGGDGKDKLFGGGGDDVLLGDDGDDYLHGDYDDLDLAYHGNDELDGGAGDDTLIGGGGDDLLRGGEGKDTLVGGDGDNTLYGDAGNDYLVGGKGDDHLYGGDGDDVLDGGGGSDVLDGGAGNDTYIHGGPTSGAEARASTGAATGTMGINDSEGHNTVTFAATQSGAKVTVLADAAPSGDLVVKYGESVVRFKDGLLHAGSGLAVGVNGGASLSREQLMALAPELNILGSVNDDDIFGGAKSDVIDAGDGDDIVRGGAGADTLAGNAGDDVLGGQHGDDVVSGGLGNDSYMFSRGDGHDRIENTAEDSAATLDQLLIDPEIKVSDVTLSRSDTGDLVVTIGQDSVTVVNHFGADGNGAIDRIVFGDGTTWSQDDLEFLSTVPPGGPGDDKIDGGPGADTLRGLGGSDTLRGLGGDDLLYGGEGMDTLHGGDGNDTLDGGTERDTLYGGDGSDHYVIERDGGFDSIIELDGVDGDIDVVQFGDGIAVSEIALARNGSAGLELRLDGTATAVTLRYQFYSESGNSQIEEVRFADGTVWDAAMLKHLVLAQTMTEGDDLIEGFDDDDEIDGKGGNDRVLGHAGNDRLYGGNGDDIIEGGDGADLLDGGAGKDQLTGGAGGDTYLYGRGAGSDVVTESGGSVVEIDAIRLGAGIGEADVALIQSGNDLVLALDGGAEQLRIKHWFVTTSKDKASDYRIERIEFADGAVWDAAAIEARTVANGAADVQTGTAGDDVFVVDNINDIINDAGAGVDTVLSSVSYGMDPDIENLTLTGSLNIDAWSNALDNIITGNAGNNVITTDKLSSDTLIGGKGDDTYILPESHGTVLELDGEGVDTIIVQHGNGNGYTLPDHVENLDFSSDYVYRDYVYGNAANNTIWTDASRTSTVYDGEEGIDTIISRSSGGFFYVDNPLDRIIFANGTGSGYIFARGDYKIDDNFRDLTMVGSRATRGEGNDFDNVLNGSGTLDPFGTTGYTGYNQNNAENVLAGGRGNDTYVLGFGDTIEERAGEGNDIAYLNWSIDDYRATATFADYAHVETIDMRMTTAAFRLDGDARDNAMYGNEAGNVLNGDGGNDTLAGRGGNDTLDGGVGNDLLTGGAGNDTYLINADSGHDTIDNQADDSRTAIDTVKIADSITIDALGIERLGDDLLLRRDDVYSLTVKGYFAGTGEHRIDRFEVGGVELTHARIVSRTNGAPSGTEGADTLNGSDEIDFLSGRGGDDVLLGHGGDDQLAGGSGDDVLNGGDGNDQLDGGDGNDVLDGGAGWDTMIGGTGNDSYHVDSEGDQIWESNGEGIDTVFATIDLSLDSGIENIVLKQGGLTVEGNDLDNVFTGSDGDDYLRDYTGGADTYVFDRDFGNDTVFDNRDEGEQVNTIVIRGYKPSDILVASDQYNLFLLTADGVNRIKLEGWDSYRNMKVAFDDGTVWGNEQLLDLIGPAPATAQDDEIYGGVRDDVIDALEGNDIVYGLAGNDRLIGGDGNDELDGGEGDDVLIGGAGSDRYVFAYGSGDDVIVDTARAGDIDTIITHESSDYISTRRENDDLVLVMNTPDREDTMRIGSYFSSGMELLVEFVDGTVWDRDAIEASLPRMINGTSGADTLNGNDRPDIIKGLGGSDTLNGYGGNDQLDGGSGADRMNGGTGSDLYYVDNVGDVVTESANAGSDEVRSSISYTLTANVESLILTGADALNGTGNSLDNFIFGNAMANVLNGGAGADSMVGGAGDDTYVFDDAWDHASEDEDGGTDLVQSSVSFSLARLLGTEIEHLTLTGNAAIDGSGNELDNILTGNSAANRLEGNGGNDVLDGGAGRDTMLGGEGNDTYVIDHGGDTVSEQADQGIDTVRSNLTTTLGANLEVLVLTGSASVNGNGNGADNLLIGNGANNTLAGAEGNDILQGGGGADTLNDTSGTNLFDGGVGADTLVGGKDTELFIGGVGNDSVTTSAGADLLAFNRGDGADIVAASTGSDNVISLGNGIVYADLQLRKNGNDLVFGLGGSDQITLKDWYASSANRSVATLQMLIEDTTAYKPNAATAIHQNKIQWFDFDDLVAAFDAARAANSSISAWKLSEALLTQERLGGSDTAAYGGDLAYLYATQGTLAGIDVLRAQTVINADEFGSAAQELLEPVRLVGVPLMV